MILLKECKEIFMEIFSIIFTKNPCKKCLVGPCCTKHCNVKEEYLYIHQTQDVPAFRRMFTILFLYFLTTVGFIIIRVAIR